MNEKSFAAGPSVDFDLRSGTDRSAATEGSIASITYSDIALLACLVLIAAAGPFFGGFYLYVFTLSGIYAIVAIGNNLLLGHGGLLSLGQGGLLAISCYVCAFAARAGLPFPVTLILGVSAAASAGFCVGLPALRLSGHYLALVTLAFAIAVTEVLIVFDDVTGGSSGISVMSHVLSPLSNFYAILVTVGGAAILQSILLKSRFGIALRLIRDSERAASSCGINVARYKIAAFVYSGVLAGIAGTYFVSATGFLSPTMFDFWLSIYFLIAVVLGGMRGPAGAVFGAALVAIVPQLSSAYQGLSSIIFGVAILAVLFATRSRLALRVAGGMRRWVAHHG
jgi:branched-chain amino acid transport system permease protein